MPHLSPANHGLCFSNCCRVLSAHFSYDNTCVLSQTTPAPLPARRSIAVSRKRNTNPPRRNRPPAEAPAVDSDIRIIGGEFRGRRLRYHGDTIVRPMKHRVREAIFNLIGTDVAGRHVIDLFAGTGALGLEAISRGAQSVTLIEKHVPTARVIDENIRTLGIENRATLLVTSAFLWAKRDLPLMSQESSTLNSQPSTLNSAWLIFCSPPYDFYVDRRDDMLDLIARIKQHAPGGSVLVVEADERFDFALLRREVAEEATATGPDQPSAPSTASADGLVWRERAYPPAVIGIWSKR
jgi:16S rRNA (guanine966-N2)-methyltransferase